jgi:hypothetical protein
MFFSIDISFKGSQSLAKMMSKVTAVSYLHSGVNDSAVHVTVCQRPRCQIFDEFFFKVMDSRDLGGLLLICFDRVHPPHLLY